MYKTVELVVGGFVSEQLKTINDIQRNDQCRHKIIERRLSGKDAQTNLDVVNTAELVTCMTQVSRVP